MRVLYTSKVFPKPLCLIAKIKLRVSVHWETTYPYPYYFFNQTRRLGENFRGIALSHSSTGLGSTNDLSWKSKNWKPKGWQIKCHQCINMLYLKKMHFSYRIDFQIIILCLKLKRWGKIILFLSTSSSCWKWSFY